MPCGLIDWLRYVLANDYGYWYGYGYGYGSTLGKSAV